MSDGSANVLPRVTVMYDCTPSELRLAIQTLQAYGSGKRPPKRARGRLGLILWLSFCLSLLVLNLLLKHKAVSVAPVGPSAPTIADSTETSTDLVVAQFVVVGCVILFVAGLFVVSRGKRQIQSRWKGSVRFTFSDEGMLRERPGKSEFYSWPALDGFYETADLLIVRYSPREGFPFPKRLFKNPQDLEFVTVLINDKLTDRSRRDVGFEVITR